VEPSPVEIAKVVDKMPPALQEAVKRIRVQLAMDASSTLKRKWLIGKEINQVYADTTGKYGDDPVGKINAVVGYTKDYARKILRFHNEFSEEMLGVLTESRLSKTKKPIIWNHVLYLLEVPADDREMLIDRIVDEDLTPAALGELIRERYPKGASGKTGRPVKVPCSLTGKLDNLSKVLTVLLRNNDAIWAAEGHGILSDAYDLPADKVDEQVEHRLEDDIERAQAAIASLTALLNDLHEAKKIVAKKKEAEAQLV
jgi:hypothetical protein